MFYFNPWLYLSPFVWFAWKCQHVFLFNIFCQLTSNEAIMTFNCGIPGGSSCSSADSKRRGIASREDRSEETSKFPKAGNIAYEYDKSWMMCHPSFWIS